MRYTNESICYVYVLLDPRKPGNYKYSYWTFDYEPFYVGKGSKNRINSTVLYEKHVGKSGTFKKKLVSKLVREGYTEIPYKILRTDLTDSEAFSLERRLIQKIGRRNMNCGPLVNLSDGGEGEIGRKVTRKTRSLLSERSKEQNSKMTEREREQKSAKLKSSHRHRMLDTPVAEQARVSKIKSFWENLTKKQKAEIQAKKIATRIRNGWRRKEQKLKLTSEERSELNRRTTQERWNRMTPARRAEFSKRVSMSVTKQWEHRRSAFY